MGWERGQGGVPPSLGGPAVLGGIVAPPPPAPCEVSDRAKAGKGALQPQAGCCHALSPSFGPPELAGAIPLTPVSLGVPPG